MVSNVVITVTVVVCTMSVTLAAQAQPFDTASAIAAQAVRVPAEEKKRRVEGGLKEMRAALRRATDLLKDARVAKDIVMLNCVNEKLTQTKGLLKISEQASVKMYEGMAAGDQQEVNHQFTKITIAHQKVLVLRFEVDQCVGERALHKTTIEIEGPPGASDHLWVVYGSALLHQSTLRALELLRPVAFNLGLGIVPGRGSWLVSVVVQTNSSHRTQQVVRNGQLVSAGISPLYVGVGLTAQHMFDTVSFGPYVRGAFGIHPNLDGAFDATQIAFGGQLNTTLFWRSRFNVGLVLNVGGVHDAVGAYTKNVSGIGSVAVEETSAWGAEFSAGLQLRYAVN